MVCSMSGSPVIHYLLEFAHTHVHWVSDTIQPSLSPPALSLSQHQGLFQWVGSLQQMSKVLQLQHQFCQCIFRVDLLWDWLAWCPCCPSDSRVFSRTTVQKHQFFSTQPRLWSNSHIRTWLLEKPQLWLYVPFVGKVMSLLLKILSRFVIAFLPRSKRHLTLWLQSQSSAILEPKKIKSATVLIFFPSTCQDVMWLDAMPQHRSQDDRVEGCACIFSCKNIKIGYPLV